MRWFILYNLTLFEMKGVSKHFKIILFILSLPTNLLANQILIIFIIFWMKEDRERDTIT